MPYQYSQTTHLESCAYLGFCVFGYIRWNKKNTLAGKNVPDSDLSEKPWILGLRVVKFRLTFLSFCDPGTTLIAIFFVFAFARGRHRRICFVHMQNALDFMWVHSYREIGRPVVSHEVFRGIPWSQRLLCLKGFVRSSISLYDLPNKRRLPKKTPKTRCCHWGNN